MYRSKGKEDPRQALRLTREEQSVLRQWARKRGQAPEGRRARAILQLDAGASYAAIGKTLGCSSASISRWQRRFLADRLDGLSPRVRAAAPRVATPEMVSRVLALTRERPPDGRARWSTRALARQLGVHHNVVARVWRAAAIDPAAGRTDPATPSETSPGAATRLLSPELPALWAELDAFGAADTDAALCHLLRSFGALVDAHDGYWLGAVRLAGAPPHDPLRGWRPGALRWLSPTRDKARFYERSQQEVDRGEADITTREHVRRAGRFRATLLRELVPPQWFASSYYRDGYTSLGIGDTVWVICPVNADAEAYYAWHRATRQPPFTPADRDRLAAALLGIPWFHRKPLLAYGLLVAERPLTPAERRVLRLLLTDRPEKQIAADLDLGLRTTHHHVTAIFRKFGVQGRAGLLALWLGHGARH